MQFSSKTEQQQADIMSNYKITLGSSSTNNNNNNNNINNNLLSTSSNLGYASTSSASATMNRLTGASATTTSALANDPFYFGRDPSSRDTDFLLSRIQSNILAGPQSSSSTSRLFDSLLAPDSNKDLAPTTSHAITTTTTATTTSAFSSSPPTAQQLTSSLSHLHQYPSAANSKAAAIHSTSNNTSDVLLQQLLDDLKQIEDTVDSLEIPARGRCRVYMAKFGYDPFEQSPNENPEAELALNAGDYIMVFDDIDEDGYFIGELIDGRRGYVPSNYLERLTGDDLFDFQANVLYKQANLNNSQQQTTSVQNNIQNNHQQHHSNSLTGGHQHQQSSAATMFNSAPGDGMLLAGELNQSAQLDSQLNNLYPPEFYEAIIGDTLNHSNFQHLHLEPEDYHRMNDYVDLEDVDEIDDECLSDYERAEAEQMRRAVAPPQRLVLERQLNKSILISWLHPQATKGSIVSYQIYVDGVMKSTVPSGDRTKALLEGVDSQVPHRISVRAIDLHGRHSNDAACTIVTGKQVPFAPACVKASHITSDSALISWLPCNSNFHHVVAVNSVEVQTVRPGVYKHLINGLSANTLYRVWVRAKPGKILSVDEKNPKKLESLSTYVDFKTMPKSLPDPPVNVQVEAGPQRRTLLVTWLPLTLNDFGVSNGCPITGYAVFAGHKKLADIDSPTGDHALLDLADLESLHKKSVTVRTKSGENLSQDSMPCHIPDEYLKFSATSTRSQQLASNQNHTQHQFRGQQSSSPMMQHHHNNANNNQRLSGSSDQAATNTLINGANQQQQLSRFQSPHRQRRAQMLHQQQARLRHQANPRQISRSMQNLESDLESRRSSCVTGDQFELQNNMMISGNSQQQVNNTCESYSEEEFENSMRCRGLKANSRAASRSAQQQQQRFRGSRGDSHSLDGQNRAYQSGSLAKLRPSAPMSQLQQLHQHQSIRYFVALFDYDPSIMSPNPNAATEELAFKEGSIIKIFGDKGSDGFYQGELDNQVGFVPCNVVSEIRDPKVLLSLQEKQRQKQQLQAPLNGRNLQQQQQQQQQQQLIDNQQPQANLNGFKRMIALYDYDPQENSPNADTESEIPFKQGDVIYIYGKMDTDGFFMGEVERTKQRGLVPSNFLRDEMINKQQIKQPFHQQQQQQLPIQRQNQQQLPNQMNMMPNNLNNMQMNNQIRAPNQIQPANQLDLYQQQQHQRPVQQQQMPFQVNRQMNQQTVNGGPLANQNLLMNPNQQAQMRDPINSQQQQQLLQQGNLINRPSTLSLANAPGQNNLITPMAANNMVPGQQQMMAQNANNMLQQNQHHHQQQQPMMLNQNQNQPQQQQQGGGVLSNLLSSGKQIIGAATTPRGPPPATNQICNQFLNNTMANQQQQNANMIPNNNNNNMNNNPGLFQQQQQQQHQHDLYLQQQLHMDGQQQTMPMLLGNSQHPLNNQSQQHQQQQPPQQQQHSMLPNVNSMMANQARSNPIANYGVGGEEQGGNILNTVKNMFKL